MVPEAALSVRSPRAYQRTPPGPVTRTLFRVRDLVARRDGSAPEPVQTDRAAYRSKVRRKAQTAHLRQTNTPGVLPSSAALERGTRRPQQPQATVATAGDVMLWP